jgi:GDPmannose 4,6-dehydratase
MWKMLQIEKPDTFILATGKNETIRNFARMAFSAAGMEIEFVGSYENETGIDKKTGKTLLKVDKSLYRPSEVEVLLGNPKKAKKELGWEATTNLEELAKIMVNYDLKKLKS